MEQDTQDEKGQIYAKDYVKNDLFWGFGIEREFYVQLSKTETVSMRDLWLKNERERYSVDYAVDFCDRKRKRMCEKETDPASKKIQIPLYWNSHSFEKTDQFREHKTLWMISRKDNSKFSGKTLLEQFIEKDSFFQEQKGFGKTFVFDGDAFEIATRKFYKKTIESVLSEYSEKKKDFIDRLNKVWKTFDQFSTYGPLSISEVNYGWVQFWTNPENVALCNNGTFHLNITLPTQLDSKGKLLNSTKFLEDHLYCTKYLQWFEPFLMSFLGSPDVFSIMSDEEGFVDGSLRMIMSRYIGMGTYDVRAAQTGKILSTSRFGIDFEKFNYWWMKRMENDTSYRPSATTGLDFNIKKHIYSGIEWRIFDSFPEQYLDPLCKFLCLACDYSLEISHHTIPEEMDLDSSKESEKSLNENKTKESNFTSWKKWFQSCLFQTLKRNKEMTKMEQGKQDFKNVVQEIAINVDWKQMPIAGFDELWNNIACRSVCFGNLGCFISVEEADRFAQIVNFPFPQDCSWKTKKLKYVSCMKWINEWSYQIYRYFCEKKNWGPCYSKMVENKDQCPIFDCDWNNMLWIYQFFYYTPRFEIEIKDFELPSSTIRKTCSSSPSKNGSTKKRHHVETKTNPLYKNKSLKGLDGKKDKVLNCYEHPYRFFKMFEFFESIYCPEKETLKICLCLSNQKQELRFLNLFERLKCLEFEVVDHKSEKQQIWIELRWINNKIDFWEICVFFQYLSHQGMEKFSWALSHAELSYSWVQKTILDEFPHLLEIIDELKAR